VLRRGRLSNAALIGGAYQLVELRLGQRAPLRSMLNQPSERGIPAGKSVRHRREPQIAMSPLRSR
jgi:hypothetical protein